MADKIILRNPENGLLASAYIGFSWTTLIFGSFPALFRGDFITFVGTTVVYFILALTTYGVLAITASLIWAFLYNKYHARKLIERGYRIQSGDPQAERARRVWKITE
jgi:hypothetical protein